MKLTPERLFSREPLAGIVAPSQLKMSADGRYGCCLLPAEDDRERLELWLIDLTAVQEGVGGRAVAARRLITGAGIGKRRETPAPDDERRRRFAHGVTAYEWHPEKHHILIPADGVAWVLDLAAADPAGGDLPLRRLTPPDTRQTAIRYSPQGNYLSYVRDDDLYCLHIERGRETRLTHDGGGTVHNGVAEFIAQEEMSRFDGHWWSPDEQRVAFARVDDAAIPEIHRHAAGGVADGESAGGEKTVAQRYPFAGGPNAEVRLGLLPVNGGQTEWLDWALADDDYLARAQFAPDGSLYVQAQARHQRRLALRRFADGRWHDVLTERHRTWVNLHDNLTFLDDGQFVWTSETRGDSPADDRAALFLCQPSGECRALDQRVSRRQDVNQVRRVLAVDDHSAWVVACHADPAWYGVRRIGLGSLGASGLGKWITGPPESTCVEAVKPKASRVGLVLEARAEQGRPATKPATIRAFDEQGALSAPVTFTGRSPAVADLRGEHAWVTVKSAGAGEELWGRLIRPTPFDANRRYPVIIHVYGGPRAQLVRPDQPLPALQMFAQNGFGIFELDNRGTAHRGKRFEDHVHGRLGHAEVADQLRGVEFLRGLDWVDANRIGIFGHSYGGYMVLMCLATSHAFRAGVSVAPVTDWHLYDTHYTERYLGLPQDNPENYRASSPLPLARHIDAPLLLMHGMADDNVLFTHTVKFAKALQDAGRKFEMMTYPSAKHFLQQPPTATHRYRCILDFFRRELGAEPQATVGSANAG